MGSLEVETLDPASYYRFRDELDTAGFTTKDRGRTWTGPIAEPLRAFTTSEEMTIRIQDGWPYLHPELEVPGMDAIEHVNRLGYVCLWARGDGSRAWMTLAGWQTRIEDWCKTQEEGFSDADTTMDAHAYFMLGFDAIATIEFAAFRQDELEDGKAGDVWGRWRRSEALLEITPDRNAGGKLRGTWFYRDTIEAPPTDLDRLKALLTEGQQNRLDSWIGAVAKDKKRQRRFVFLIWGPERNRNGLVVLLDQMSGNQVRGRSIELAPTDRQTLLLRAGEEATAMQDCRVTVFGSGSVGSHLALLIAESGVGSLALVDKERLRPGNVVRHAAPAALIGVPKVEAVAGLVSEHAPWTTVETFTESPWDPERMRRLVADQDLVIDATGITGFAEQLAALTALEEVTMVSATLYRQGHLARVQRQAPGDTFLAEHDDPGRYPTIPHDPADEEVQLEAGCSAPVNRASPRGVVACAALAAEVAIDALAGRLSLPDEITDIYRPLEEAPFDRVGRLTSA